MRKLLWAVFGLVLLVAAAGLVFFLHPLWVTDQVIRLHLWQQGVRSEYVTVDGQRMHYFEAGPVGVSRGGHGMPLVLIHGLESRGEDWAGLIPSLAAHGYHVYVPDLLGYGRSSKPDIAFSIAEQERAVSGLLDAVGVRRADLGGWSMGGWVALKLAMDEPARVNRVVVYDSAGIYFTPTFTADDFGPADPAGVMRLSEKLSPHPVALPDFVARGAVRKLRRDHWVVVRSLSSMEAGQDLLDFKLAAIRQPVLIVWGRQDRLIPLAVGERLHGGIAGSNLLVVDGCGHLAPAECLKPVLRGTEDFLSAEPAPAGVERLVPGKP